MATIDAVIVGAGTGTRLGYSAPKAFVDLCGKPLLHYSVSAFCSHPSINKTILVVPPSMIGASRDFIGEHEDLAGKVSVTAGGGERWQSVQNGVSASTAEWVLIHDAARPFVTHGVIDSVLDMRDRFDCVITATPEVDTIRTFEDGGRCGVTLDRSKVLRVGTPQMFRRDLLMSSFGQIKNMLAPPTDEAALFESQGTAIGYSWGDPVNFKITTKADLEIARALIERNRRISGGRDAN
jgi:2-C-methyl-D-erythritol 4-phosphate cytidylyltransferase